MKKVLKYLLYLFIITLVCLIVYAFYVNKKGPDPCLCVKNTNEFSRLNVRPFIGKPLTEFEERSQRELAVKSLQYFDKLILNKEFIACNKFSYADIQAAVSLQFLVRLNRIDINDYQNLSAYINNITSRPSFSA